MVDVSKIRNEKKAVEVEKGQLFYELEAEKKAREEIEGKKQMQLYKIAWSTNQCYFLPEIDKIP